MSTSFNLRSARRANRQTVAEPSSPSHRRLTLAVMACAIGLAAAERAGAEIKYRLLDVGSNTFGYGLNDYGQVAGTGPTTNGGFITSPNSPLNASTDDFGSLGYGATIPFAVNNSGQVTGSAPINALLDIRHAFLFDGTSVTDINGTYNKGVGWDINSSGSVAGTLEDSSAVSHAALSVSGGALQPIGSLAANVASSAYGINDAGDVVGTSGTSSGDGHAFLYHHGTGVMDDLASAIGVSGASVPSAAIAINNNGDILVAVTAYDASNNVLDDELVVLNADTTVTHIPSFSGVDGTTARLDPLYYGMDDSGHVVGSTYYDPTDGNTAFAFYFDGSTTHDLNDLIDPDAGVNLTLGMDINESGQILANGSGGSIDPAYVLTPVTKSTWTGAGANWSSSSDWSSGVPKEVLDVATFATTAGTHSVTLDTDVKVGTLVLNSSTSYTISGTHTLTFETQGSWAQLQVLAGSHTIAAPVVLAKHTEVATSASTSLTITGNLSGSAALLKSGAGTLTVNNVRLPSLTVSAGTVKVATNGGDTGTSVVSSLDVASGATLDLSDNDLIVDYTGTSPISSIVALLTDGYNSGTWAGDGITSSTAAASTSPKTALGYAEASTLGVSMFSGQAVDSTAILVKYTYAGDSNLDGKVDLTDQNAVLNHFGMTGATWFDGDFNYDGVIDLSDLNAVNNNFGATPMLAPIGLSTVPEPAGLGLLLTGAAALGSRRRRRR